MKIYDLDSFRLPRIDVRQLLWGSGKLEKSENRMLGGAIGAPEARNMLGMLVVMSLQLSESIGGIEMEFLKKSQNMMFLKKMTI